MKLYSEVLTVQTANQRELMNITPQVKAAVQKSEVQEGIAFVGSLHVNAAVIVHEDESGMNEDLLAWVEKLAPRAGDYKHGTRFESPGGVNLQTLLLHHEVTLPIAAGRLDLGPWQSVFFVELDGGRPKRYTIKVLGE